MNCQIDALLSPELLEPLWEDIGKLESRGCYKEAFLYLRAVTEEINSLRQSCIGVYCLLERYSEPSESFQTLQSLVIQHLAPIEECSNLMYLDSLRVIMETLQQALSLNIPPSELQSTIASLCCDHNDRLRSRTDLLDLDFSTQVRLAGHARYVH